MESFKEYNDGQLLALLTISQGSLAVMSHDLKTNLGLWKEAGKRYRPKAEEIRRIDDLIRKTVSCYGEIRARNYARAEWRKQGLPNIPPDIKTEIASLAHYHGVVQKRFIKELNRQGDIFSGDWAAMEKERIAAMRKREQKGPFRRGRR